MEENDKGESTIPEETKEELKVVDGSESSLLEGNPTNKNEIIVTPDNGERTPKGRRKSSKREWTEEMINIEGGDVKYLLFGSKKENSNLCILLHGLDFISAHFKSLIESIGMMKGTTALAFDFLGRGESSFVNGVSDSKLVLRSLISSQILCETNRQYIEQITLQTKEFYSYRTRLGRCSCVIVYLGESRKSRFSRSHFSSRNASKEIRSLVDSKSLWIQYDDGFNEEKEER